MKGRGVQCRQCASGWRFCVVTWLVAQGMVQTPFFCSRPLRLGPVLDGVCWKRVEIHTMQSCLEEVRADGTGRGQILNPEEEETGEGRSQGESSEGGGGG